MTELIDHIDQEVKDCIDGVTVFGLCHLIEDDNGSYPATVELDARRVTPDSNCKILTYHRLLNGSIEPREDLSFGRRVTAQNAQRVRMVVFIDMNEDESLIDDIINALPDNFLVEGYQDINLSKSIELIRDRAAVWDDEFPEAYRLRYQKRFHIYAVEYSLEYVKCRVCETSP